MCINTLISRPAFSLYMVSKVSSKLKLDVFKLGAFNINTNMSEYGSSFAEKCSRFKVFCV